VWIIAKIAFGVVGAYAAFCVAMFLAQKAFLFHPTPETGPPAAYGLTEFRRVEFVAEDGVPLVGWLHETASREKAILFFYGNADALPPYAGFFRSFAKAGYSVLGVNYRGYGGSGGEPSETGFYADADAGFRFLARHLPAERITVVGRSIGTGVAVDLAARNPVRSLVLISPFTSVVDAASEVFWYLPVSLLLRHRFSSIDSIRRVKAPILIVHGDADTIIPVLHARLLHEAAAEPKRIEVFEGADHIAMDLDRIFRLTVEFDAANERR
jgi:fermentation-respiration switch protein FrsA (DUF1100 family)